MLKRLTCFLNLCACCWLIYRLASSGTLYFSLGLWDLLACFILVVCGETVLEEADLQPEKEQIVYDASES